MTNSLQARYVRDLAERVAATFGVAFIGQLIASGWFTVDGVMDLSVLQKAGIAGLMAVLTFLKGLAARFVGSSNTAALLPEQDDTPRP